MTMMKWSIIIGLWTTSVVVTQDKLISLSFGEIVDYSEKHSLIIKNIKEELALTNAEKNIDLQWSNPTFNMSKETVNSESEAIFTLNKEFEFPWIRKKRRNYWTYSLAVSEYKMQDQILYFESTLKKGYCEIKLLETQSEHLSTIRQTIENLANSAQNQFQEGAISGIEINLIQIVLEQIKITHQTLERNLNSTKNNWKIMMGIDDQIEVTFSSPIQFQPIEISSEEEYLSNLQNSNRYKYRLQKTKALQEKIKLEQTRIIPHFGLFGGVKTLDGSQGLTAGISIPIPIFNRNKAIIKKQTSLHRIAVNELDQFEQQYKIEIRLMLNTILELDGVLKELSEFDNNVRTTLANIFSAYEEGWLSLSGLLNAIQIHNEGIQQYYTQMNLYYKTIFELEALTGETLITFLFTGVEK